MSLHPFYERLVNEVVRSDPRPDLPSEETRKEAIYAFLDRDADDGRDTIEIPRGDMGETIESTFDSLSFEEENLDDFD